MAGAAVLPARLRRIVDRIGEKKILRACHARSRGDAAIRLQTIPGVGEKFSGLLVEHYWSSEEARNLNREEDCQHRIADFVLGQIAKQDKSKCAWKIVCKRIAASSSKPWLSLFPELQLVEKINMKSVSDTLHATIRRKYAESVLARCLVAYPNPPSVHGDVEILVTASSLSQNPMAVFRSLRLSTCSHFVFLDRLALDNGWWRRDSPVRCDEAIYFQFEKCVEELKCTAVERDDLLDLAAKVIQQPYDAVCARAEQLLVDGKLIGYETSTAWLVTTPEWAERASIVYNTLCDRERSPEPDFVFREDEEEEDWVHRAAPMRDCDGCLTDAFLTWLIGRVAGSVGLPHPPTEEQIVCVLTMLRSSRSILTAEAGTGKTDYGLRIAVNAMQRLGYKVLVATPTHAAKRPIVAALGWEKKHIHTIKSLTFVPPWGRPPKLEAVLQSLQRPLAVFLDEFGMCGTEDAAELFSILQRARGDVRIAMTGDHRQLPPVPAGNPFEDAILNRAVPVCTMTKVFRAEACDLVAFNRIYRAGQGAIKDWSLDPRSACYILEENSAVSHIATATAAEMEERVEDIASRLREQAVVESDLLLITHKNEHCLKLSHTLRRVFRPEDEASRVGGDVPSVPLRKDQMFTRNDRVCFNHNTAWYKNGDETTVVRADATSVDVDISLDEEDHALMLAIHKSRETPDDDFWVSYRDGLPEDFRCIQHRTWRITVAQDRVKPLSAVTFYKSQGAQSPHVIVALTNGWSITSRFLYTAVTRARRQLALIGPRHAFDNEDVHTESCGRTTVLSALMDGGESVSETDDREPTAVQVRIRRMRNNQIKKSLRVRTWERFHPDSMWGVCACCRRSVSVWTFHVCHIVADSTGGGIDDENLCVGCPACNLSCGSRNFAEFAKIRRTRYWAMLERDHGARVVSAIRRVLERKFPFGCDRIVRVISTDAEVSEEDAAKWLDTGMKYGAIQKLRPDNIKYDTYQLVEPA